MPKFRLLGLFDRTGKLSDHLQNKDGIGNIEESLFGDGFISGAYNGHTIYAYLKVYNIDELKHVIDSLSDDPAELILGLYQKEGIRGFRRLNGKFTIIIREKDRTTIVRDRNGKGPMVYFTDTFFTSSYQDLFLFRGFRATPDMTGITTFLKIGYIPAPITSLAGVSKVPAGEILIATKDGFRYEELYGYKEIIDAERKEISFEEALNTYNELLKNSLKRRINDSNCVGTLLSGGYDSGGNIALLREVYTGKIKSFSIGFKDNPASELPYARMMADKFDADHVEYVMDGSEIEYLPDIIDIMGDPFSESGFMLNYAAMKVVGNEDLPVVIGGDGNDQYFGAGIRETALHYKMRKSGLAPFAWLFDKLSDNSLFDKDNLAFRLHFQNQKILKVMEPETFGFHDFQLNQMFGMKDIKPHPYLRSIPRKFGNYEELFLQRNYYLHIRHSVNEVILHKAARFSDAFDVNLSFSYTDLDIYHFLQRLPIHLRAKGSIKESMKGKGVSKYLLKELVRPKLPEAVTNRPKQGGFSPLEIFFNDENRRKQIYSYIRNSSFGKSLRQNNFLNVFFENYEQLSKGKGYWFWHKQVKSNQLINLLILSIWWDKVVNNRKESKLSDYIL